MIKRLRIVIVAVVLTIAGVVGGVVALAGGSAGQPTVIRPARDWLRVHRFLPAGQHPRLDIADVARTLLEVEPNYRVFHRVHTDKPTFRDALVTAACTYVFGHAGRIDHALHVHGFRFHDQASGPNVSALTPGGADHDGYALQCGYGSALGTRLLELDASTGGLSLVNLARYAQARAHDVTAGLAFTTRPYGLQTKPRVHRYLVHRLARVECRL
jgi:hypothetical protein